jgi:CRP-like cAMP-binding protein/predicted MFS family arabinose efflux permease
MLRARRGPIREALKIAAVRRIVLAFHALTLAEWVLGTAVAISAYDDGGALAVGLVGFRFAPAALAGFATALLGERFGRRRVLTTTALVRAGTAATIAVSLAADLSFGFVLALVWFDAAAGSAYRPAQAGLLPALVTTPGQLTAAAVLTSNAKSAGQVLGAVAGGLLFAVAGAPAAVAVAAALYAAAALLTALIARTRAPARARRGGDHLRQQLLRMLAGVQALKGDGDTRRIAAWSCARSLVRGLWVSLGIVASLTILGMGDSGFALLMVAAGVGTVASIPLTASLVGRRLLAAPFAVGLALCCLPVGAIGLVDGPAPAVVLMVVWGVGMSLADVGAQALVNRVVEPSELARVVGLLEIAKLLAEGLGALLAPLLVTLFGIRGALAGAGFVLFALLLADVRAFRAIDRRAVGRVEVLELVHGVPLFAPLRVDGLEAVAAPLQRHELPAGEDVIRQDTIGTRWYLVDEGELEVVVDGYVIDHAVRGDAFGERALLRNEPRSATVRALTPVALLVLERASFLAAVVGLDESDAPALAAPRGAADALGRQHLLRDVGEPQLRALAQSAVELSLRAGEILFSEGDTDDRYVVVLEGEFEIRTHEAPRRTLGPGDAFGEIAVLHECARTASAVALTPALLVAVDGARLRAALAR